MIGSEKSSGVFKAKRVSDRKYKDRVGNEFCCERGMFSNEPMDKGDCGKLMLSLEGFTTGKYLGLHVAGSQGPSGKARSLTAVVTKEMIECLLEAFEHGSGRRIEWSYGNTPSGEYG